MEQQGGVQQHRLVDQLEGFSSSASCWPALHSLRPGCPSQLWLRQTSDCRAEEFRRTLLVYILRRIFTIQYVQMQYSKWYRPNSTIILQRHQSWCVSLEREMLCVWGSATCQSCHRDLLNTDVSLQWRRPLWIKRQGPTGPVILSQRPQPWSQTWTEQNLDWKKEKSRGRWRKTEQSMKETLRWKKKQAVNAK